MAPKVVTSRSTRLTPAPLPQAPLDAAQRLACLRLIRSDNVGPVTFRELINHFGGAEPALDGAARAVAARRARSHPHLPARRRPRPSWRPRDRIGARPLFTIEPGYPPALAAARGAAAAALREGQRRPPGAADAWPSSAPATARPPGRSLPACSPPASARRASSSSRGSRAASTRPRTRRRSRPARSPCWRAASTTSIRPSMPSCSAQIGERGCLVSENAAGLRAARAGLSPPQPHHLRHVARRADRGGGAALGHADHGAHAPPSRAARCSPCRAIRSIRARKAPTAC